MNSLISFLAEFCKAPLLKEKIFIVPSYQLGHQIGEVLTSKGHSWVNLHFVTLPSLAQEIAGVELSTRGVRQISKVASLFMLDMRKIKLMGNFQCLFILLLGIVKDNYD